MYIYLDIETTGVEENDEIVSIALICDDTTYYDLVLPSKKIKPDAMAVHHITNEMTKDTLSLFETPTFQMLNTYNIVSNTLVIHNAKFILKILKKYKFEFVGNIIDTHKSVKHLIPECGKFSLQFLRYELKLYLQEIELARKLHINIMAHHALSDALHIKLLHNYLLQDYHEETLIQSNYQQTLITRFSFGKYNKRHIEDIARKDPSYLHWILNSMIEIDEDLRYSVEYFLNEVEQ